MTSPWTRLTPRQQQEFRRLTDVVVLGIAGAGASLLFGWLLRVAQSLFLGKIAHYLPASLGDDGHVYAAQIGHFGRWLVPVSTTLGGLITGILVFTFAPEAEGHGTDTVVAAYHRAAGKIRDRVPPLKMIASAITIGSGGSAGREGPTALITAGFGSMYGGWLKRSDEDRRFLLVVGMAAGLSAVFRSPIGTAVFAMEVLYSTMDFESSLLIYTMLASIIAYAVNGIFVGLNPMFAVPASLRQPADRAYGWYAILGVICGVLGVVLPIVFYSMRELFRRLPMPRVLKPAVGGLAVGLIAIRFPDLLGGGYASMQLAINGELLLKTALVLGLLKILTLSLTVSSGGSGGVFAPSLFVGCMVGAALAGVLHQPVAEFAIVGMAALFGAAARVPFATLLMIVEMTGGYQLLVPAGMAVTIAYMVQYVGSSPFKYRSLYEAQVPTRAQSAAHYVEGIRSAIEVVRGGYVRGSADLGSVDLLSLLSTGVAIEAGAGQSLITVLIAEGSPVIGLTLNEARDNKLAGCCRIVAVFHGEQAQELTADLKLAANDRLLILTHGDKRDALKDLGLLRTSGIETTTC